MRNNILGAVIAAGLLAGSVGGYAYLTSDHTPQVGTHFGPSAPIAPAQTPSQPAATPTSQPVTTKPTTPTYVAPSYTVPKMDFTPPPASTYYAAPVSTPTDYTPVPAYHVTAPVVQWHTKPTDSCIGASAVGC